MKTTVVRYETNYLLALSRYPEHFYPIVAEDGDIYHNPGISLRSYVLSAGNVREEFLDISGRMLDVIKECIEFCGNREVIVQVHAALMSQPYDVAEKIGFESRDAKMVAKMMERLNDLNSKVDDAWKALLGVTLNRQIDLFSPEGKVYKQACFDLRAYTSELIESLKQVQRKS